MVKGMGKAVLRVCDIMRIDLGKGVKNNVCGSNKMGNCLQMISVGSHI